MRDEESPGVLEGSVQVTHAVRTYGGRQSPNRQGRPGGNEGMEVVLVVATIAAPQTSARWPDSQESADRTVR